MEPEGKSTLTMAENTTQPTAIAKSKIAQLDELFIKRQKSIEAAAMGMLNVNRLRILMLHSVQRKPELLKCSIASIISSVMLAAELGLEPDDALGSCYLVPFGAVCQLIPGYRGLVTLARRSGEIRKVEAHIRYKKDKWTREQGDDPKIIHIPYDPLDSDDVDPGPVVGAYAVAWFSDGSTQHEYLPLADLKKIQSASKAKRDDSPWNQWPEEMMKKSAIKRLCKKLPLSIVMARAVEIDNAVESGVIKDDSEYLETEFTDLTDEPSENGNGDDKGKKEDPKAKKQSENIKADVQDKAAEERKRERTMIASDFGIDDKDTFVAMEVPLEVDLRAQLGAMHGNGADLNKIMETKPATWEQFIAAAGGKGDGLGL
jgi:recombination protein RecT